LKFGTSIMHLLPLVLFMFNDAVCLHSDSIFINGVALTGRVCVSPTCNVTATRTGWFLPSVEGPLFIQVAETYDLHNSRVPAPAASTGP
jgi:hypothetical protein